MILQLVYPWMPWRMVLGGLPLDEERIWQVHDALCVAEELDSTLSNQFPTVHLQTMDLLFQIRPCQFRGFDALAVAQLVEILTYTAALAINLNTHHAAPFQAVGCD